MTIADQVALQARRARASTRALARLRGPVKNQALNAVAAALRREVGGGSVLSANAADLEAAAARGTRGAMLDRLRLDSARLEDMAASVEAVALLPDPVGETIKAWRRPNGLEIAARRVPLGVVGIVYEARPNVTIETASLCLKSGNACVLRGGSEALGTNRALAGLLVREGLAHGLPEGFVEFLDSSDRESVRAMLMQEESIDLIVPRGGEALIRMVVETSRIPVVKQYKGVCHTYVDAGADLDMALAIALNAKVSRPSVCNAMETLLVHAEVAPAFLPRAAVAFAQAKVELRGCPRTRALVPDLIEASEDDWSTEYLDLILSVRVVESLDEAMDHIARYGTQHSEAIVTRDLARARRFHEEVDSACVYVNASTRFTDGYQFGFGAEVGISTGKLHSRGPMGLEDLTTRKYVIWGDGQIRG